MKRESQPSAFMIASRDTPSSSRSISFARRTCATGAARLRCKLVSSSRSSLLKFIFSMHPIWGALSLSQWTSAYSIDELGGEGKELIPPRVFYRLTKAG